MKVCWISAGVSSFVSGWLVRDSVDEYIYIDIKDQHPDSNRFIKDCEIALGKPITTLKSTEYETVGDVCRAFRFVSSPYGAKCTDVLKRRVRKIWEFQHKNEKITYIWGLDINESNRADRLIQSMPEYNHVFPLIHYGLTKQEAHGICNKIGIKRPVMYDMGYSNNNCIGCVKGGMAYWNKIRKDFPKVFDDRAKMEREIGHTILRNDNKPIYLDELSPEAGRNNHEILEECNIFCTLAYEDGRGDSNVSN